MLLAPTTPPGGGGKDPVLARMRAAHLKTTADAALSAGNAGEAAAGYAAAAGALPPGTPPAERARLAANVSLAWLRAGRADRALMAAQEVVTLAPTWDKAHWRVAAALAGVGRHADALGALRACAATGGDPPACRAAAGRAVARLPRRDVARCMVSLLEDGVAGGRWPACPLRDDGTGGAALALVPRNSSSLALSSAPPARAGALALVPDVRSGPAATAAPTMAALLAAAERLVAVGEGRAAEEGLAGESSAGPPPPPPPPSSLSTDAPPPALAAGGCASTYAGAWRGRLAAWVLDPLATLHPATALGERSAIGAEAGGWAGAVLDGRAAVAAAAGDPATPLLTAAAAHLRLAEALLASPGVDGRDCRAAAAAAVAGLACLPARGEVGPGKSRAPLQKTPDARAVAAVSAGLAAVLRAAEAGLPTGAVGDLVRCGGAAGAGVSVRLAYPPPTPPLPGPGDRARLVAGLAGLCARLLGLPSFSARAIALEGVRRSDSGDLVVRLGVRVSDGVAAAALVAGLGGGGGGAASNLRLGGEGANAGACPAITAHLEAAEEETKAGEKAPLPLPSLALITPPTTALALPPPPPRARLTTAAGSPLDGPPRAGGGVARRHPFRLSRIHYSSLDLPLDAWVELADSTARWRQSAGEVRVVVAAAPAGLRPADLSVRFRPRRVTVKVRREGEGGRHHTLWDARLARHIVPGESTWTFGGGVGEDGLVLGLAKANLELLAGGAGATAADTWWPRLLRERGGGEAAAADDVAWDDYDKDYSDLPAPFLAAAAAVEAASVAERCAEAAERAERAAGAEEEGVRVRARAARLDAMRGEVMMLSGAGGV